VPSLYLRKDRPVPGAAAESANIQGKASSSSCSSDDREFIEEIDLHRKLKSTEFSSLVAEEKWEPQLRALQVLFPLVISNCYDFNADFIFSEPCSSF
jgi:hypothetical protein